MFLILLLMFLGCPILTVFVRVGRFQPQAHVIPNRQFLGFAEVTQIPRSTPAEYETRSCSVEWDMASATQTQALDNSLHLARIIVTRPA